MTIYYNDERDYSEIIEGWIREFMWSMDEDEDLFPGYDDSYKPAGV